jgi:hypothetical protein
MEDGMAKRGKSRSKSGTRKVPTINLARIKREIAALEKRRTPSVAEIARPILAQMRGRRRALAKTLGSMLASGQLDLKKAAPLLARYDRERELLRKKMESAVAPVLSATSQNNRRAATAQRKLLATPGLIRPPHASVTIKLAPFLIRVNPFYVVTDESRAPGNAFVKFFLEKNTRSSGNVQLFFFYLWQNESTSYAVVNAACVPFLTGGMTAGAESGVFDGGYVTMEAQADFGLMLWNLPSDNSPHTSPPWQTTQQVEIQRLVADAGGFWSGRDIASRTFAGGIDLSYRNFSIPPGQLAVFQVFFTFGYNVDDGYAIFDFATRSGRSIAIPSLDLELLTAPAVNAGPFGTVVGASPG